MNGAQLTPRDLYRLRHSYLMAHRATLRAQYAQHQLQELTLELERRYGLLAREAVLDIQTGVISSVPAGAGEGGSYGPSNDAHQSPS